MEVKKKWHKCILVRSGWYDDLTDVAADLIVVQLGGGSLNRTKGPASQRRRIHGAVQAPPVTTSTPSPEFDDWSPGLKSLINTDSRRLESC